MVIQQRSFSLQMSSNLKLIVILILLTIGYQAIAGHITMNYKKVADAEVEAWQAYYQKSPELLLKTTGVLLESQYNIKDTRDLDHISQNFFSAYHKFGTLPQNSSDHAYHQEVLPLVIKAYESLKNTLNASWNATDAAKADLSWWIARRNDKQRDPELVGKKIESLYIILYGDSANSKYLKRAGYLRAVAARYRDLCQDQWGNLSDEDWEVIHSLLVESYHNLDKHIKTICQIASTSIC